MNIKIITIASLLAVSVCAKSQIETQIKTKADSVFLLRLVLHTPEVLYHPQQYMPGLHRLLFRVTAVILLIRVAGRYHKMLQCLEMVSTPVVITWQIMGLIQIRAALHSHSRR